MGAKEQPYYMNGKWKIIPNSGLPGFNKISFEIEKNDNGNKQWYNAEDENDLKYFLQNKEITNLEYLEGLILLRELQ